MTKCLHCKTEFIDNRDDYESRWFTAEESCNCGGCYASKEELKNGIRFYEKLISELKETLEYQ